MAPGGQRSIASFFSPLPSSAKKKVALHIGLPDQGEGKRKNAVAGEESPSKRSRVGLAEEMQVPAADDRSIAAEAEATDGHVGRRLKVYWPEERRYFAGVVRTYDPSSRKCKVCYDDGDEEMVLLENEKFSWLDGDEEAAAASETVVGKRRRVRRHGLVASLDEGSDVETKNGAKGFEVEDEETKIEVQPKPLRRRRLKKVEDKVETSAEQADTVAQVPATSGNEEFFKNHSTGKLKVEVRKVKNEPSTLKDEVLGSSKSADPVPEKQNLLKSFLTEDDAKEPEQVHRAGSDQLVELSGEALERFGGRDAAKFSFLGKYRKDASGRRADNPRFDPRTLFLPAEFCKGLSEGQRQWWEFKARHMDKVLLFKMGKFYEMFEMDAHIGVQDLDLQYMKGEQPHCGFPEKNYAENAARLARKGHRVLVIEQTETPEQLEARKRKTGAKDKVVRREICAVITKGTMVDAEMVGDNSETAYLLAVTEKHESDGSTVIGLCAVDTSRALFMVGQLNDDAARTKLKSILSELRPVELVKPSGMLSEFTERALHAHSRSPLVNNLVPTDEFWTAERTMKEVSSIYIDSRTPEAIRKLVDLGADGEPALSAFGGCVFYLRKALLHQQLLNFGRIELLSGSDFVADSIESSKSHLSAPYMALDSAALENLEILENNSNADVSGTLLGLVDQCGTPFGRRLLKKWIVRPLVRVESILERQCAIEDLQGDAANAASDFRKELAGIPDLERLLARLNARSGANGRDGQNVVLYEDAAKKRIKELLAAVRGCQTMISAISSFGSCLDSLGSDYLRSLVTPGKRFPSLDSLVQYFKNAFDWSEAEQSGQIQLNGAADENAGTFSTGVPDVKGKFSEYLQQQRQRFKTDEISYVNVGKDTYLLEIPEELHSKVPFAYELRSSRKGYRRYWTPEIKELLQELSSSQDQMETLSKDSLQMLTKRLCSESELVLSAIQAVSELDALMSLSSVSLHMEGRVCRPTFSSDAAPFFNVRGLRHPLMSSAGAAGTPFVPNDVVLGGSGIPHFMLLTGPNMGGKSTLLRQVCLAIILAQVGAHVPAETLELTPVDRLFVRMGAKDHIMSGQSTFLVELLETATMLRCASKHSFVALDELGRGTATTDGQAIAHAVLHHLAHQNECRGMFSTHYHRLADDHSSDKAICLQHLACEVAGGADGLDAVTFLYKLTAGSCPKSYGANVARIAGMPESVLAKAAAQSRKLEEEELNSKQVRLVKDILKAEADEALISLWRRCH